MEKNQLLTFLHSAQDYFESYKKTMDLYEALMQQIQKEKSKRNRALIANLISFLCGVVLFGVGYYNLYLRFDIHHVMFSKTFFMIIWVIMFIGFPLLIKKILTKHYQKILDRKIQALASQSELLYHEILEAYLEYQESSFLSLPFSYCYPDYIEQLATYVACNQATTLKEAIALLQEKMNQAPSSIFHHLMLNAQQIAEIQDKEQDMMAIQSV